jgi:protein tyrosine/serine phosphatase
VAGIVLDPKPLDTPTRGMRRVIAGVLGLIVAFILIVVPIVYYRHSYTHSKRLREVSAGKLYRSGAMTGPGFRAAIERYGLKTIINLQEEAPDPDLPGGYFGGDTQKESELCRQHGVKYVTLTVDLLPRSRLGSERPAAIDAFLRIMDDPDNYPVLVHCRAGLHRTGCLVAVYRMEYDRWSRDDALSELKHHGFGEFACSSANDYISQYILAFQRAVRKKEF